jgi:hypothetical protein
MRRNKIIDNVIEEYLNDVDFSDISSDEDIIEAIDVDYLAKVIADQLRHHVLKFEGTPKVISSERFNQDQSYTCDTCFRPYGVFHSENGLDVPDTAILKNGAKIILAEDILQ